MLTSTETLLEANLANHILTQEDLARAFGGTPQRRYALVNKALANGELVRLKRGVYCLADRYRVTPLSELHAAGQIVPGSYVSFESALAFHGWIPERVVGVQSAICRGRFVRHVTEAFGEMTYVHVPTRRFQCLVGVGRRAINTQPFLIADPLRAIGDHVYARDLEVRAGEGRALLEESLRIEPDELRTLVAADFDALAGVYSSRRVTTFLRRLRRELGI